MTKTLKQFRSIETQNAVSTRALAAKLPWMVEMVPPASLKPAKRNARARKAGDVLKPHCALPRKGLGIAKEMRPEDRVYYSDNAAGTALAPP